MLARLVYENNFRHLPTLDEDLNILSECEMWYKKQILLYTISGAVIPVRPVKPIPAIQVRRTTIRPVPEITAIPQDRYN